MFVAGPVEHRFHSINERLELLVVFAPAETGSTGLLARRPGRAGYTRGKMSRQIRVVVAEARLDGHDRGAKIIARTLRDAGMEVIYTGLHQTPEQIVETVIQEDADAVGISILSGAHMTLVPRILELLKERGRATCWWSLEGRSRPTTSPS